MTAKVDWIGYTGARIDMERISFMRSFVFCEATIKVDEEFELKEGQQKGAEAAVVETNKATRERTIKTGEGVRAIPLSLTDTETKITERIFKDKKFKAGTYKMQIAIGGANAFTRMDCDYEAYLSSFIVKTINGDKPLKTDIFNTVQVRTIEYLNLT